MYCLRCNHASPVGSVFCGRCGRSFGCRVCPSGHRSPAAAKWCVVCGKPGKDLSDATRFASGRGTFPPRRMGICARVPAVRAGATLFWPRPCRRGRLLGGEPRPRRSVCAVVGLLYRSAYLVILVYLLSYLLPASAGSAVRRTLTAALSRLPRLAWGTARFIWRLAALVVEGHRTESKKPK